MTPSEETYWAATCKAIDKQLQIQSYKHPSPFRTAILEAAVKKADIKIPGIE